MRLTDFEVGCWFRSPRWSENAVGELVGRPRADHGLAAIHVHCRNPVEGGRRASSLRARLATVSEMARTDWELCQRPEWVTAPAAAGALAPRSPNRLL